MNPIPVTWCAAGALGALALGALGGWTVRDWQRDSEALASLEASVKALDQSREQIDRAASTFEQERADAATKTTIRENTIREIYKDRPVPADCAVPDAATRVLDDAIADANARASGQPASALRAAPATP